MFWQSHRPDRPGHGRQYMAAVFCDSREQEAAAHETRARIAEKLGRDVHTPVISGARFYLAEDYHQKYYLRHDAVLMRELAHYTLPQLIRSTVAARLNGYVAGHGTHGRLQEDIASFGLSATGNAQLERLVRDR
ncbi:MAG: peptide methionine sulfoxide reductase [Myxococcales bacterium]|nr:peptide methionine sulfoxide reductase [Myxococcales bacterium]